MSRQSSIPIIPTPVAALCVRYALDWVPRSDVFLPRAARENETLYRLTLPLVNGKPYRFRCGDFVVIEGKALVVTGASRTGPSVDGDLRLNPVFRSTAPQTPR